MFCGVDLEGVDFVGVDLCGVDFCEILLFGMSFVCEF